VPYDLEDELVRIADELGPFTLAELGARIATSSARLSHPLLAHMIEPLLERLVHDGLVVRTERGFAVTDRARAYLRRSPALLAVPPVSVPARENLAIGSFRWGEVVDSHDRVFKDARHFRCGVEEWDRRWIGTRHDPGIHIADLADLLQSEQAVAEYNRRIMTERVVALIHRTC
jgi:hypothetical protein